MSMFGDGYKSDWYDMLEAALERKEISLADLLDIISTLVSEDWGLFDIKLKDDNNENRS